jgi:hypothetical protein
VLSNLLYKIKHNDILLWISCLIGVVSVIAFIVFVPVELLFGIFISMFVIGFATFIFMAIKETRLDE